MSESGKKRRRSRKTKEEKMIEKINKEEAEKAEQEQQNQTRNQPPAPPTADELKEIEQNMSRPDINQKMMDMDVRIKYGFIKTLHNNLISINRRFNWEPEEMMAIGMIFRDLKSIELNVYNTVMQNEENNDNEEEVEEEEEEEEEVEEDVN